MPNSTGAGPSSVSTASPTSTAPAVIKTLEDDFDFSDSTALALRTPPRTPELGFAALPQISTPDLASSVTATTSSFSSESTSNEDSPQSASLITFYQKPERSTPEDPLVHMYRHRTMPALHPTSSGGMVGEWRTYIVQAVDSDTTLRYVAASLATYHDNFLSSSPSSGVLASKYYGKGLTSMTSSFPNASVDSVGLVHLMMSASVLLGVEYFRRNYPAIRIHLISIIKVLGERPTTEMTAQLTLAERFFRRTYLYFTFFPALYPSFDTLTREEVRHRSWLPEVLPTTFSSLNEADNALHDLFWPWMFYFQALNRAPHLATLPAAYVERNALLAAFTTWITAFESFLARAHPSLPQHQQALADVFRLWSTIVRLGLMHSLSPIQVPIDTHIPVFKTMVSRAISIDRRVVRDTRISLEPVLSYMTPTWFIIVHCRDPAIRRDAIAVVNRVKVTHAQWYPPAIVRAGVRLVEIEEGGWEKRLREELAEDGGKYGSQKAGSVVSGRAASVLSDGNVRGPPGDASLIIEEDRVRNVRLNIDAANGLVQMGYFCWYGEEIGWKERREELNLNMPATAV